MLGRLICFAATVVPGAELWMQEEEQTEEKAKMVTIAFLTAVWPGVSRSVGACVCFAAYL